MASPLIDPFDREVRRLSRPIRNDGLRDDSLSYRTADDFGRLWGDALAEYEARTGTGQRSVALTPADIDKGFISRVESARPTQQDLMDNPTVADPMSDPVQIDALRHELFDPLTQRFGSDRQTHTRAMPAPRTYKTGTATSGEKIISIDPLTGWSTEVFSTPGRAPVRTEKPIKIITASSLNGGNETISLEPSKLQEVYDDLPDVVKNNPANMVLFKAHGIGPYARAQGATGVSSAPESRTPQIFMGDPLAAPQSIEQAPAEPPTITSKAQFDALPSGAVYVSKNGKRHRKP